MHNSFTKGLIVGGFIGASISAMMNSDMMSSRNKKRMMRNSRSLIRKSGHVIGDVVDLFR